MGAIKSILLTGGTGYLGSNLAKAFVARGLNVFILKRQFSSLEKILPIIDSITLLDINDVDFDIFFSVNKIDAVIHVATVYGRKGEQLIDVFNTNLLFSVTVLQYAIDHGVEYFFYSNTALPAGLNEYSLSKRQFGDILKLKSNQIKVIDIELQYFYGPLDDITKFVTFIISQLKTNVSVIDLSPGTQVRDFIYIDDVVSAYLKLIDSATLFSNYTVVPLGSGEGISLKHLVKAIKEIYKDSNTVLNFGAFPLSNNEITYLVADISFLKKLGWYPKINLKEGLLKVIDTERAII